MNPKSRVDLVYVLKSISPILILLAAVESVVIQSRDSD